LFKKEQRSTTGESVKEGAEALRSIPPPEYAALLVKTLSEISNQELEYIPPPEVAVGEVCPRFP
jgi:hypothetical protein